MSHTIALNSPVKGKGLLTCPELWINCVRPGGLMLRAWIVEAVKRNTGEIFH